jgi:hypothetical protein
VATGKTLVDECLAMKDSFADTEFPFLLWHGEDDKVTEVPACKQMFKEAKSEGLCLVEKLGVHTRFFPRQNPQADPGRSARGSFLAASDCNNTCYIFRAVCPL